MKSRIVIDTSGLDSLMRQAPGEVDAAMGEIAANMAADIIQSFSRKSPSDPGDPPGVVKGLLKNSIQFKQEKRMLWIISAGTEYAPMLEYGTVRMAARPFVRPAARRAEKRIGKAVARALKRARS